MEMRPPRPLALLASRRHFCQCLWHRRTIFKREMQKMTGSPLINRRRCPGLCRAALCLCFMLAGAALCRAAGVVTNCTEADLQAALIGGGQVTFACDGALELSSTLVITNDTALDATGHEVTLNEGPVLQAFRLVQI